MIALSLVSDIIVGIMVLSMVTVLLLAWKWFGSLRTAFLVMLLVGKTWCGILWAFGIDKPLFNLIIYNKIKGTYTIITFTACEVVFLSFLITFVFTVIYPYIEPHIPEPMRKIQVLERGERK